MPTSDAVTPRLHPTTDRYVEPTLRLREERAELMRAQMLELQGEALSPGSAPRSGQPA